MLAFRKTMICIAAVALLALVFRASIGASSDEGRATVTIADGSLRAVIADSLGKTRNAPITRAKMATLTRIDATDKGIRNLTGLEHATNLTWLNLQSNSITDISALSVLTNLEVLSLSGNRIVDISPLAANTGLGEGD